MTVNISLHNSNNALISTATLEIENKPIFGKVIEITEFFIVEKFRNFGFGKELLGEVINYAREDEKISLIGLTIKEPNPAAEALVKGAGFSSIFNGNNWLLNLSAYTPNEATDTNLLEDFARLETSDHL